MTFNITAWTSDKKTTHTLRGPLAPTQLDDGGLDNEDHGKVVDVESETDE